MPLFAAYHPPKPDTKTHHHKHVQTAPKKKQTSSDDARTMLPMNGGSAGHPAAAGGPTSSLSSGGATTGVQTLAPANRAVNSNVVVLAPAGAQSTGGQAGGQTGVITLIPNDAIGPGNGAGTPTGTAASAGPKGSNKLKFVHELYFDWGDEDLIGSFSTLVVRLGVRYEQHEIDAYFRNENLNTVGTNLPFQQIIQGSSYGAAYRYWLPGNHMFLTVSDGYYFTGFHEGQDDFRLGAVGFWDWENDKVFTDIYADYFYIDLAQDTFLTARLRSGLIVFKNKTGKLLDYGVAQLFNSGSGSIGTENRVEAGFGLGYVFENAISLNVEMRAGYAYRGLITNRAYLNPMIVLSGSFQ